MGHHIQTNKNLEQLQYFNGGNSRDKKNFDHQSGQVRSISNAIITDEQIKELRRQIAAYEVISERTREIYTNMSMQQQGAAMPANFTYSHHRPNISLGLSTKRWAPNRVQLELLEKYYGEYNGRINDEQKKDIFVQLSSHGQITEANVHNWFQNKKARDRKKKLAKGNYSRPTYRTSKDIKVPEVGTSSRNLPEESNGQGHDNVELRSFDDQPSDIGVITAQSQPMPSSAISHNPGVDEQIIDETDLVNSFFNFKGNNDKSPTI